jgi:hypothetical protein
MEALLSVNVLLGSIALILALIILDLVTKVAVSVYNGVFDWSKLLLFLRTNVFPYVIVFGGVEGFLFLTKYVEYTGFFDGVITAITALAPVVYAMIVGKLIVSIFQNLKEIGIETPQA